MGISIMKKLKRLLSKHFEVERTDKGLKLRRKSGRFSRTNLDLVMETADRYGANVWAVGHIYITRRGGSPGQASMINQGRRKRSERG